MKAIISLFAIFANIFVFSSLTFAQGSFENLIVKLDAYAKNYPKEKVHLHLDKPYYTAGDDIWLKAYVMETKTATPSMLSKILHVELIDESDSIKAKLKLFLQNGVGWGDIYLPKSLYQGNYRLRAYTNLMRNYSPDFFFNQKLIIGGTIADSPLLKKNKSQPANTTNLNNKPDIQLLPESGNLVVGLPSKIAIKAINNTGKGINVKGIVVDENDREVVKFNTKHLGMGSFFFTPINGKNYKAKVTLDNGETQLIAFPQVKKSGFLLSVNNKDTTKVLAKVLMSEDLVGKGELSLLVHQDAVVFFSAKIPKSRGIATISLPKEQLLSGVITLTLFENEQPVAERLIFINNHLDQIVLQTDELKASYNKRENVNINFLGKNEDQPVIANYSIAITNTNVVKPDLENETNIFSSMLLKSNLKGYIENPNYYFASNAQNTLEDLDLLMLTHGWTNLDWSGISNNQLPPNKFSVDKGIVISGIAKSFTGKPVAGATISLFSNSGELFTIDTIADASGRFSFYPMAYSDTTSFVITAFNQKNKRIDLQLDPPSLIPEISAVNESNHENINQKLKQYISQSNNYFEVSTQQGLRDAITLKEVELIEKKKAAPRITSLIGEGKADRTVTAKQLENVLNLTDFVPRIGGGIYIKGGNFYSRTNSTSLSDVYPMLIVLDGVYKEGFNAENINPMDIEKIEILTSPSNLTIYGSRGSVGVVVITTKTGPTTTSEKWKSTIGEFPKGYSTARKFYSPKYENKFDDKPDLRTTVYWNPNLITDEEGKININYFNTDQAGKYRVVIEGIDNLGNLARKVYTYEVK